MWASACQTMELLVLLSPEVVVRGVVRYGAMIVRVVGVDVLIGQCAARVRCMGVIAGIARKKGVE